MIATCEGTLRMDYQLDTMVERLSCSIAHRTEVIDGTELGFTDTRASFPLDQPALALDWLIRNGVEPDTAKSLVDRAVADMQPDPTFSLDD